MDTKQFSDEGRFAALFQQIHFAAEQSANRKGEAPRDIPPAQTLVRGHVAAREQFNFHAQRRSISGQDTIRTTQLPCSYLPCTKPAHVLKPMLISEMRLETHHRDRKVLLRVLAPSYRINAVMAVVEDQSGTGALLQLYHLLDDSLVPEKEVVYEGRVCVLKEPFFKVATDGSYSLRVDHVNDIVWLAEDDEQIPAKWRKTSSGKDTSLQRRTQGNDAVKRAEWAKAVRLYSSAIKVAETKEESELASLNRSLANLKLGLFEDALADASRQEGAPREKALFREARALLELAKYEESLEKFKTISVDFPENTAIKPYLQLAQDRLLEARDGQFSFSQMYKQASDANPIIDCATYSSPVEVRPSEGRGRGLFTTRSVSAGELLLCEKAFGYCYAGQDSDVGRGNTTFLMQVGSKTGYMGGQASLITQIVQKLQYNPGISRPFLDLHHGNYQASSVDEVDGRPVVDTFRVAKTISANVFGAPRTSLEDFKRCMEEQPKEKDRAHSTSGIWLLASRINHSCIGNCQRTFIGDMMIVRANRDLPEGAELLWQYKVHDPMSSYEEVQSELKSWAFRCDCAMCIDKKKTPKDVLKKRKELISKLDQYMKPTEKKKPTNLDGARSMLNKLQETYTNPIRAPCTPSAKPTEEPIVTPRIALVEHNLALGGVFLHMSNRNEAVAMTIRGLEAAGFEVVAPAAPKTPFERTPGKLFVKTWGMTTVNVIFAFWNLFQAYFGTHTELGRTAKKYLITSYAIMVGESETVLDVFPSLE